MLPLGAFCSSLVEMRLVGELDLPSTAHGSPGRRRGAHLGVGKRTGDSKVIFAGWQLVCDRDFVRASQRVAHPEVGATESLGVLFSFHC